MKKRILINVMLFGPGGGATHLLNLCNALIKEGVEVTLVSRYARETTPVVKLRSQIPIRFVTTPFARHRRFYRLSTLWALLVWPFALGGRKYDALYTWELSPFTRFLSLFVQPNGYVLFQRAGEPLSDTSFDQSIENLVDGVFVESPIHAEAARRVLRPGIPILTLPLLGHCLAPRRHITRPSPDGTMQITFLGRYHRDKGIYRLVEIWPDLSIGQAELSFHAWGDESEELRRKVVQLGLEDQIHLHGPYSTAEELSALLAETDLLVLPSETEGLPVVLLEAMAHGVPFVATDVGAVRALADNNPDVRVVPLNNRSIKEAIEEMVHAIRSGQVKGWRLQDYYHQHYGYEMLLKTWTDVLLRPDEFLSRPDKLNELRSELLLR